MVSECGKPKPGVRAFVREAAKYTSVTPILVSDGVEFFLEQVVSV